MKYEVHVNIKDERFLLYWECEKTIEEHVKENGKKYFRQFFDCNEEDFEFVGWVEEKIFTQNGMDFEKGKIVNLGKYKSSWE